MKKNFYYGLGRPFSPFYSIIMRTREYWYRKGVFRSSTFKVPVISIGNLTMGGTGKTPMVQYLARFLKERGYKPAIISRGYGGATRERVNIVSNGSEVLLDASYVGDEPRLLAESLPGVPVLTGVVRKLPAAKALDMGADILLLDDGFQHLAIRRDLDLVLFNADVLAGNSRVFPGGDLREPVKALHRCHVFVLTGTNEHNRERAEKFGRLLEERFPGKPMFFTEYRFSCLVQQKKGGRRVPVARAVLDSQACFAFCGIAQPESFRRTLEQIGVEPVAFESLPDHHVYRKNVVQQLVDQAEHFGATCFLCTEKDLVKLSDVDLGLPLYAVAMEVDPGPSLAEFVLDSLEKQRVFAEN